VGVVTDRQWQIFTAALGEPDLMDPTLATNTLRAQARETLIPKVAALLKKRSAAELEKMCESAGLPFARVITPAELFDDPHLLAGGMTPVTLANGAVSTIPLLPIQLGDWRPGTRLDLPQAGEHNAEILN
jgi:crotonobetainyl-CoA:carnitine CoA-transferase CaiB-like acyl-CoA transferase